MNKVLAVFRKEYLETRTFTLVFWLVGVLFPALGALQTRYEDFGVFSNLLVNDPVTLGGILAVWLNATFLFATSFARERENGTFQTLRFRLARRRAGKIRRRRRFDARARRVFPRRVDRRR